MATLKKQFPGSRGANLMEPGMIAGSIRLAKDSFRKQRREQCELLQTVKLVHDSGLWLKTKTI